MGGQNALSYTCIVESLRQTPKRQICPCGRRGLISVKIDKALSIFTKRSDSTYFFPEDFFRFCRIS